MDVSRETFILIIASPQGCMLYNMYIPRVQKSSHSPLTIASNDDISFSINLPFINLIHPES
jgi:hypothetical protein